MWKKHLAERSEADNSGASTEAEGATTSASASSSAVSALSSVVPNTPKKLLGSLLDKSEVNRLEEELMTARLTEVESQAELKESRLKVMELETQVRTNQSFERIEYRTFLFLLQNQVIANQLKRQGEEVAKLSASLESKTSNETKLQRQLREAQRKYADLESRMKEDLMMARIRDAENTQCVAELTQKISSLEYKVYAFGMIVIFFFYSSGLIKDPNVFISFYFIYRIKKY